jgi:hypothetical protein
MSIHSSHSLHNVEFIRCWPYMYSYIWHGLCTNYLHNGIILWKCSRNYVTFYIRIARSFTYCSLLTSKRQLSKTCPRSWLAVVISESLLCEKQLCRSIKRTDSQSDIASAFSITHAGHPDYTLLFKVRLHGSSSVDQRQHGLINI